MSNTSKKILITCALPYANGPIHLGHILEHIQADIWVRYHKMQNKTVYFICADDAHGTPIMLKAKKLKITPEKMIEKIHQEHKKDLNKFGINFDNYHSTHSNENYELLIDIYERLKKQGFITSSFISQFYDLKEKIFLSDRFIIGTCPKCNTPNQYGDNCEICSTIYNPTELISPKSTISGTTPIIKKTKHFFFNLPIFKDILHNWVKSGVLQKTVYNKMQEWFVSGLKQWDISRDEPYFGFEIPNEPKKYFYVWLDAPIGYMGSFKNFCTKSKKIKFEEFWHINSTTELHHFIGKDIIYFHSLFWPAVLEGSKFRKPTSLIVHGYLTINGTKMSKSRGTFITANSYLKYLDADCLRYYYASKLSSNIDDIDLDLQDFIKKVNSDVVNKIVNLASRTAKFICENYNGDLSNIIENTILYKTFTDSAEYISQEFQKRNFNKVVQKIMKLTNIANQYIDHTSPWILAKQRKKQKEAHNIYSMGIQLFRIIMTYIKPILPSLAKRSEEFLNYSLKWETINTPLQQHRINKFKILFHRIELYQINKIINDSNNTES